MTSTRHKTYTIIAWLLCGVTLISVFILLGTVMAKGSSDGNLINLASGAAWALVPIAFVLPAALIVSRQPQNLIGWLLMMPAITLASDIIKNIFDSPAAAPIDLSPAATLALWFSGWSWLLFMFPIFFIFLLFPTGRPVSPRWRLANFYVLGVWAFFFIIIAFQKVITSPNNAWSAPNPFGFIPVDWFEKYFIGPFAIGLLSSLVLCVISMVFRYRHAYIVEREQIKWLLYACGLFAATYILIIMYNLNSGAWGEGPGWVNLLMALGVMTIPAAIAIAILRYRLWDIDIIIRKTLIYGALTVTLAAAYFGMVTLLQALFTAISKQNTTISIVVSTLLIAALFTRLRNRIQRNIDRRFYRKKYDAQKTLESFAASVRDEVELEDLTGRLLAVVQETMQPEQVSLWLKERGR